LASSFVQATASVAVWPERDTLLAENFAFMPPITKRCAMVSRNGKWGKGKVDEGKSWNTEMLKAETRGQRAVIGNQ
jgi:hypothetical protein